MPLVVGQLLHQMLDLAGAGLAQNLLVAKLSRLGAKFAPQLNLRGIHVGVWVSLMHRKRLERLASTFGSLLAC